MFLLAVSLWIGFCAANKTPATIPIERDEPLQNQVHSKICRSYRYTQPDDQHITIVCTAGPSSFVRLSVTCDGNTQNAASGRHQLLDVSVKQCGGKPIILQVCGDEVGQENSFTVRVTSGSLRSLVPEREQKRIALGNAFSLALRFQNRGDNIGECLLDFQGDEAYEPNTVYLGKILKQDVTHKLLLKPRTHLQSDWSVYKPSITLRLFCDDSLLQIFEIPLEFRWFNKIPDELNGHLGGPVYIIILGAPGTGKSLGGNTWTTALSKEPFVTTDEFVVGGASNHVTTEFEYHCLDEKFGSEYKVCFIDTFGLNDETARKLQEENRLGQFMDGELEFIHRNGTTSQIPQHQPKRPVHVTAVFLDVSANSEKARDGYTEPGSEMRTLLDQLVRDHKQNLYFILNRVNTDNNFLDTQPFHRTEGLKQLVDKTVTDFRVPESRVLLTNPYVNNTSSRLWNKDILNYQTLLTLLKAGAEQESTWLSALSQLCL
eukprot:m.176880 g.176880  ORF g.176880 m.176880 type:complete len:488 (-) comp25317_c0_seq2:138-1601(-)